MEKIERNYTLGLRLQLKKNRKDSLEKVIDSMEKFENELIEEYPSPKIYKKIVKLKEELIREKTVLEKGIDSLQKNKEMMDYNLPI